MLIYLIMIIYIFLFPYVSYDFYFVCMCVCVFYLHLNLDITFFLEASLWLPLLGLYALPHMSSWDPKLPYQGSYTAIACFLISIPGPIPHSHPTLLSPPLSQHSSIIQVSEETSPWLPHWRFYVWHIMCEPKFVKLMNKLYLKISIQKVLLKRQSVLCTDFW